MMAVCGRDQFRVEARNLPKPNLILAVVLPCPRLLKVYLISLAFNIEAHHEKEKNGNNQ
jgi:hypothetical protein